MRLLLAVNLSGKIGFRSRQPVCRLYRWIAKEKLRLAELNIDQELIEATCRYLSSYNVISGNKMVELMNRPVMQFCLDLAAEPYF